MATGTVDITKTIPAPPEPSWSHWWDPKKRVWMSHDPKVLSYIKVLATCPDPEYLVNLTEMVLNAPDLVETDEPE